MSLQPDQSVKHQGRSEPRVALLNGRDRGNRLSLSFIRDGFGMYPDTGESGDAYDAEAFLEASP